MLGEQQYLRHAEGHDCKSEQHASLLTYGVGASSSPPEEPTMAMLQIAVAAPGTCLAPGHRELGTFDTHSITHNTTTFTRHRHLGQHPPVDDVSPETHPSTRYSTRYADHSPGLGIVVRDSANPFNSTKILSDGVIFHAFTG
jgi:hypothetical protein